MSQSYFGTPNYKRTTDKQYNLLKHKMVILSQRMKNCKSKNTTYKKDYEYWAELTESLNSLGPPYRNMQQWKKVWSDHRRSIKNRKSKARSEYALYDSVKIEAEYESYHKDDQYPSQYDTNTPDEVRPKLEKFEMDSQTMETTYSNEYDNDYSYADDHEEVEEEHFSDEPFIDDDELLIPEDSSNNSYNFAPPKLQRQPQPMSNKRPNGLTPEFATPPPLQPSNARLLDQTLYALQNQMEHQTKLLEHLSTISSTMASLMERQVNAVERQTEAMKRQAMATERHTSVMNNFATMIRDKMLKGGNAQKGTVNLENDVL